MGGLHHEESIGKKYKVYFEGQVGIALRWVTDRSGEMRGASTPFDLGVWTDLTDYCYTDHFYGSPGMALKLAVGTVMDEHWLVDFGFLYMGKFDVDGYEEYEITTSATSTFPNAHSKGSAGFFAGTINPMMLILRLGYRL